MTPVLLTTLVALVAALPPTVDHWLAQKIKGAALMAFSTALFGVFDGSLVALLSQVANGSTWADAETLGVTGLISGVGTALVNYIKSSTSGTASGGGSNTVAITGSGIPASTAKALSPTASPRVVDVKWRPSKIGVFSLGGLAVLAFVVGTPLAVVAGLGVLNEGCTSQQAAAVAPVVGPVADLGACVAEGALAGLSLEQIAAKCGGTLEQVIAALFASTDEKVKASAAYGESVRIISMPIGGDAGALGSRK